VAKTNPTDLARLRGFAGELREQVDERSTQLLARGECILHWLETTYERRESGPTEIPEMPFSGVLLMQTTRRSEAGPVNPFDPLGLTPVPIPYDVFKARLSAERRERTEQLASCAN
jgi:hypothetical protein